MNQPDMSPASLIAKMAQHCTNFTVGEFRLSFGPEGFTINVQGAKSPRRFSTFDADDLYDDENLWFLTFMVFIEWGSISEEERQTFTTEPFLDKLNHWALHGHIQALHRAKLAYNMELAQRRVAL